MRLPKFRAWDGEEMIFSDDTDLSNFFKAVQSNSDEKVMQFTGLHDKNGKEIYEGDIISRSKTMFGEVYWDNVNSLYRFRDKSGSWTLSSYKGYEVIGNIYENPDLLT